MNGKEMQRSRELFNIKPPGLRSVCVCVTLTASVHLMCIFCDSIFDLNIDSDSV